MKTLLLVFFPLLLLIGSTACNTDDGLVTVPTGPENNDTNTMGNQVKISIGSSTFRATLGSNAAVTAFKARLPLTISMKELNGNEKFADLTNDLPTNASKPGTIQTGDLMLYGNNTLVLFYKSFQTPYSYTKLGRIENPAGLAAALGTGSVTVTFE